MPLSKESLASYPAPNGYQKQRELEKQILENTSENGSAYNATVSDESYLVNTSIESQNNTESEQQKFGVIRDTQQEKTNNAEVIDTKQLQANKKIKLDNEHFAINFNACAIEETDLAFAILLQNNALNVEPKKETKFTLSFDHRTEDVYYISAPFNFHIIGLKILILIKEISDEY